MTPADLAEQHQRLVYAIAVEHRRARGGDLDDLIGDGMVALMVAAHRYDPDRGVPFSAFARKAVRGAMIEAHQYDLRHHPVARTVAMPDRADPQPGPETVAIDRQLLGRVLEAVADLPIGLRSTASVIMRGVSFRTLAAREGVTASAISLRSVEVRRLLTAAAEQPRVGWPPCRNGHPLTPANRFPHHGYWSCRTCRRVREGKQARPVNACPRGHLRVEDGYWTGAYWQCRRCRRDRAAARRLRNAA